LKTILCVDDIEANLYTLEAIILQKKESYKVVTALSGQEALSVLLYQDIDMILLDVMMPEMNGFETAKFILKNKKTRNIPIIFVTAKKDDETIAQCYNVGGVDYLNKPYSEVELFARISFHLELIDEHKKLQQERDFAQKILDTLENIVLVTDGVEVTKVNKRLLDYFDVDSRESFTKQFGCLVTLFVEEEGCFYPHKELESGSWIEQLYKLLETSQQIVAIENRKTKKISFFSIDVSLLGKQYLVTLTDVTQLSEASKDFEFSAFHDSLTGVYNRQRFNMMLATKFASQESFAFIMLDIDRFKKINDTYGHLTGDKILQELATEVQKKIRNNDIFARWGGEEFVIILDNVHSINVAKKVAEQIRKHIQSYNFYEVGKVTCSFGVTICNEDDTIESVTKRADEALYEAKETGRNRVCVSI
jgi:diguanylate cyclase (GGDEF)-like protein